jgi:hypothetical protein
MKVTLDYSSTPVIESIEIHESDVWDMDITLAKIIHPMLVKFKSLDNGYPSTLVSDELTDDESRKQWHDILDDMIYAFGEYPTHQMRLGNDEKDAKVKRGIDLFAQYYYNLWD